VIGEVLKRQFAVPATQVREIITIPDVTAVPAGGDYSRGVINLRGQIIPLIDMRRRFGWRSVPEELEEFYKMMAQREEDHRNWLQELQRSVVEGCEFRLAKDPHNCAFGKWYYSYRPENVWVGAVLRRFETPHNKIHSLAVRIDRLVTTGKKEEALRLIEQARTGVLGEMIALFDRLKELMREASKEVAMVLATPTQTFAASFDGVVAVERIPSDKIEEIRAESFGLRDGAVRRIAHRGTSGPLALVLEPDSLLTA
jgi:purine-binding chemotaxis protein CheW